uniref:GAF domain-containing protein n=1 Tax=Chrysotila carterae TaxID=13221 RepID=A0A7S4AZ80_CHRCT|mmetsp:Transcript_17614/g.37261  ORF Transcript_17614/g.37261 Transcript_17614/m.37261 type:complete len:249 (+) Transcript_17614:381-1127(+)
MMDIDRQDMGQDMGPSNYFSMSKLEASSSQENRPMKRIKATSTQSQPDLSPSQVTAISPAAWVAPEHPGEVERMKVVNSARLLEIPTGPEYNMIAHKAAAQHQVPVALVVLMDSHMALTKGVAGWPSKAGPRQLSFCAYTILPDSPDVLVVLDAQCDERFMTNPYVTGPPFLRFYAGAPVIVRGQKVGTVCLIDVKPHTEFTQQDEQLLMALASQAASVMEASACSGPAFKRSAHMRRSALWGSMPRV